jgi:hypothetical protein
MSGCMSIVSASVGWGNNGEADIDNLLQLLLHGCRRAYCKQVQPASEMQLITAAPYTRCVRRMHAPCLHSIHVTAGPAA